MRRLIFTITVLSLVFIASAARAESFADQLNLKPMETVTVQYRQTLKTMDSFAREALAQIYGKSSYEGQSAVYTVLDMSFRPEQYVDRNIIRIRHVPLRQDFQMLESLSAAEKERILKEGRVSYRFLLSPQSQELMTRLTSTAIQKAGAINEVYGAATMLDSLFIQDFPLLRIIPPATNDPADHKWHNIAQIGEWANKHKAGDMAGAAGLTAYGKDRIPMLGEVGEAMLRLRDAWRDGDAAAANQQIEKLATILPQINPDRYPSAAKRTVEVHYNRLARLTLPGAALYFGAFVLFLLSARAGIGSLRLWGLRLFVLGFLVHTAGIGIRWWLVKTQAGNWFEGIPIKNMFESVMFSAWFGCLIGLLFEMRRPRGIFGASASFVGWLSLIAIFTAPFIYGRDIGGQITQSQGVLMSYWLYIHVTVVVASYALIGMSFLLSIWWLARYLTRDKDTRLHERQIADDNAAFNVIATGGVGAASLGFTGTLARLLFIPVRSEPAPTKAAALSKTELAENNRNFLAVLDLCNVVILQLAFWLLGIGIVFGAIWADMSWGRPWGWDPKETFALVTWIVYLVIVHVRFTTTHKAFWTAILSIIGFFIMLFNWIGVNFFLVGLHSYA